MIPEVLDRCNLNSDEYQANWYNILVCTQTYSMLNNQCQYCKENDHNDQNLEYLDHIKPLGKYRSPADGQAFTEILQGIVDVKVSGKIFRIINQ